MQFIQSKSRPICGSMCIFQLSSLIIIITIVIIIVFSKLIRQLAVKCQLAAMSLLSCKQFDGIDDESKTVVSGYIRLAEEILSNSETNQSFILLTISKQIIYLIICFYHTKEFFFKIGKQVIRSNHKCSIKKLSDGYNNTSYGYRSIPSLYNCIVIWTLKIHTCASGAVVVGITANHNAPNRTFQWDKRYINYSYLGDLGNIGKMSKFNPYGPTFTNNDIIQIILDLNKQTLSFKKNGHDLGIAFQDIVQSQSISYKLAITAHDTSDGVTIIDFQQIFCD